jgi:hypothetical protein
MNINATCQMTEAEYERERAELDTIYGLSGTEAAAKRDQGVGETFLSKRLDAGGVREDGQF